jgi:hypothetical protein
MASWEAARGHATLKHVKYEKLYLLRYNAM